MSDDIVTAAEGQTHVAAVCRLVVMCDREPESFEKAVAEMSRDEMWPLFVSAITMLTGDLPWHREAHEGAAGDE